LRVKCSFSLSIPSFLVVQTDKVCVLSFGQIEASGFL